MIERTYKIINPTGLDAKKSSVLVTKCGKFNSEIKLQCSNIIVNLMSIMGVMSLIVHKGELIVITFSGDDEEDAYKEITNLINDIKLGKEF